MHGEAQLRQQKFPRGAVESSHVRLADGKLPCRIRAVACMLAQLGWWQRRQVWQQLVRFFSLITLFRFATCALHYACWRADQVRCSKTRLTWKACHTRLPAAIHVSLAATWCLVCTLTTPRTQARLKQASYGGAWHQGGLTSDDHHTRHTATRQVRSLASKVPAPTSNVLLVGICIWHCSIRGRVHEDTKI